MRQRRWTRRAGLAAALVFAVFGLSACTPSPPLGVRKDGDKLTVLIGRQCGGAGGELSWLRVTGYVERNKLADTPLWEIHADKPRATPSVVLGVVPDGFRETVNNLGSQGIGARIAVEAQVDRLYSMAFDVKNMRDGKVLDSDWNVVSQEKFNDKYGCS